MDDGSGLTLAPPTHRTEETEGGQQGRGAGVCNLTNTQTSDGVTQCQNHVWGQDVHVTCECSRYLLTETSLLMLIIIIVYYISVSWTTGFNESPYYMFTSLYTLLM